MVGWMDDDTVSFSLSNKLPFTVLPPNPKVYGLVVVYISIEYVCCMVPFVGRRHKITPTQRVWKHTHIQARHTTHTNTQGFICASQVGELRRRRNSVGAYFRRKPVRSTGTSTVLLKTLARLESPPRHRSSHLRKTVFRRGPCY